eukprot:Em0021g993a
MLDCAFYLGVAYGIKQLAAFSWRLVAGVRTYFLPYGRCSVEKFGKWAVITGATSGIGQAYAEEFARKGLNVVLISRAYDDLLQLVSHIQSSYDVQAYGIHADFSVGLKVFHEIEAALSGLEIGILVNNVAVRYDHPQYYAAVPEQRVWQMLNVNVAATTMMTHMLLPAMLERRKGAIINVCSNVACTPPIPLQTGVAAAMAYVKNFSEGLHQENRHRGIIIQTLLPCFVATGNIQPSILCPHPSLYVQHALSTLGIASSTCGYWPHAFQAWIFSLIPSWLWIEAIFTITRVLRRQALEHSIQRADGHIFARKRANSNAMGRHNSSRPHSPAKAFNFSQVQHASFVMRIESIKASPGILKKISHGGMEGIATPSSVHSTNSPITSTPSSGLPSHEVHSVVMVVPSLVETPDNSTAQNSATFEPVQETEAETQPL